MRDGRKTTSIARRIAWSFQWKKFWGIFWQTALLGAAAVVLWCAAAEYTTLHGFGGKERVIITNPVWSVLVVTEEDENGDEVFLYDSRAEEGYMEFRDMVKRQLRGEDTFSVVAVYCFTALDGEGAEQDYYIEIGVFLFWLCLGLLGLWGARLALWLLSAPGAVRRIRRQLKPIDDIAQVTESISSRGFDESKFHSLEEAIDHLNGASVDEKLQIGDDELAGLETAVNNLIVRLHNSYRQQVRFVDDASHELRTPIAVIQGYTDMLDRWGKTDPQVLEESIRAIQTETEHMKTLVEQLLFLARGDAGRQALTMERLDIAALVREVWEESRMIDPEHDYILQAEEPVFVRGDEAMLKQAVRILVDNGVKYSPADSRITLRAYAGAGEACIDVQDNGIGVSAQDARRIFDRFYRADAARNSQTGGSGLGLSIARWIVGKHGGSFRVTSYEEIGARITIVLPPWRGSAGAGSAKQ